MVNYSFSHSIDSATQAIIMGAIAEIENKTCLRFHERASNDHIEFTGEGDGCSTTSVEKSKEISNIAMARAAQGESILTTISTPISTIVIQINASMEHVLINFSLTNAIVPKVIVGYSVKWCKGVFESIFATVVD